MDEECCSWRSPTSSSAGNKACRPVWGKEFMAQVRFWLESLFPNCQLAPSFDYKGTVTFKVGFVFSQFIWLALWLQGKRQQGWYTVELSENSSQTHCTRDFVTFIRQNLELRDAMNLIVNEGIPDRRWCLRGGRDTLRTCRRTFRSPRSCSAAGCPSSPPSAGRKKHFEYSASQIIWLDLHKNKPGSRLLSILPASCRGAPSSGTRTGPQGTPGCCRPCCRSSTRLSKEDSDRLGIIRNVFMRADVIPGTEKSTTARHQCMPRCTGTRRRS